MKNNIRKKFLNYLQTEYMELNKVIEVGIGENDDVYQELALELEADVYSTDLKGECDFFDDITNPNLSIYEESDLIYSIRPPIDIQRHIAKVCEKVEADLVLIPFKDEVLELNEYFEEFKLKNIDELVLYEGIS